MKLFPNNEESNSITFNSPKFSNATTSTSGDSIQRPSFAIILESFSDT